MDSIIRREFLATISKAPGGGDRRRKFVISTPRPDRDSDTVSVAGWRLEAYRKNPVVLWAHSYDSLPVAKAVDVHVQGDALVAIAEFTPPGVNPLGDSVLAMIDGGFLNATSVGFKPLRYVRNEERGGLDFLEQELLEFSVVPVPANADALALRGVNEPALRKWLGQGRDDQPVLDLLDDETITFDVSAIDAARAALARTRQRVSGDPTASVTDLDPSEIRLLVAQVVRDGLAGAARDAANQTLNRLRGRVD